MAEHDMDSAELEAADAQQHPPLCELLAEQWVATDEEIVEGINLLAGVLVARINRRD